MAVRPRARERHARTRARGSTSCPAASSMSASTSSAEEACRARPVESAELAPLLHLLGLSSSSRSRPPTWSYRARSLAFRPRSCRPSLQAALRAHRRVQRHRTADGDLRDPGAHAVQAAADPVEPRCRAHPRRDRRAHALALRLHAYEIAGSGHDAWWLPVSNQPRAVASAEHAERGATIGYWLRARTADVPQPCPTQAHSPARRAAEHLHAQPLEPNVDLPKLDLEDEKQWGVGQYEQFSWKSLLDTYACTECARCTNYCPAYNTGKNLSPMQLIHDIRYEMLDRVELRDKIARPSATSRTSSSTRRNTTRTTRIRRPISCTRAIA